MAVEAVMEAVVKVMEVVLKVLEGCAEGTWGLC